LAEECIGVIAAIKLFFKDIYSRAKEDIFIRYYL